MKVLLNYFYFWSGFGILILAKIKHKIRGYKSPKPFAVNEIDRCINYDMQTVDGWLKNLAGYVGDENYLRGRHVLELGPGSDLGVGLILLSRGAMQYTAIDANNLVARVPLSFYEKLFKRLSRDGDIEALHNELDKLNKGKPERLNYVVRDDFDLVAALEGKKVDVIFSQAAFEHFDDIHKTVKQLTTISTKDAVLVMSIDLRTHSRWIRDRDPNNIYRFPSWLYRMMHFDGIPNRIRPSEYMAAFVDNGWQYIVIKPSTSLTIEQLNNLEGHLSKPFRNTQSDMQYLTITLCARRSGECGFA